MTRLDAPMLAPAASPLPSLEGLRLLAEHFARGRVAVLTGAGCSTESGIPDYRGPETARRARNPIQYREFLTSPEARQRYWARAFVGWRRFRGAQPNAAHAALATLEGRGLLTGLVTQNVDRLHQAAGSTGVVELHGALEDVVCLSCGRIHHRDDVQAELEALNPGAGPDAEMAPDGDAVLGPDQIAGFRVVDCAGCGGPLKPHVVFFGESVPKPRVERAHRIVEEARCLLVVGSSLTVYSGFRFVRRAAAAGTPIVIVNLGPTRGDPHAALRLEARAGEALPRLLRLLE